jgi:uncharacterized protein (TIGR03437 family)
LLFIFQEYVMNSCIRLTLLALALAILDAQPVSSEPGGVLRQLTVTRFLGSGAESIQAMTSDAAGNVYVAGTTSSPDLPVKNAAQPAIGEGLVMRSTDRGLTWQKLSNPPVLPVTITPHPSEPNTLFVGGVDGIYKTVDGGQTWRHVYSRALSAGGACCFDIVIDPANTRQMYVYVFGAPIQFLVSSDNGESWQSHNAPSTGVIGSGLSSAQMLWVDPNGFGTVGLGLLLSRDHGVTWTRMTSPPMWTPSFTVPNPRHAGWIYAATSAGTSGRIYLSQDWGTTWTERPSPTHVGDSDPVAVGDLLFDPDLANKLYANDFSGSLDISDDAGASWHAPEGQVYPDFGVRQALLSRQCMGGALLVVSARKIAASLDFGATWQPPQLSRVLDLATGPGCAVYAVRSIASDAFVAKLAPGGSEVLWSTFLGGSDLDASAALALDADGNVYVAGNTASADFPTTAPRVGVQGRQNVFAVKLNPDGQLIYSVVYGGEYLDSATALAVNANGEAHVVGWTDSKLFPVTPGAFQTKAGAYGDGFAIKLDSNGNTVYVSYLPTFATYSFSELTINPPNVVAVAAEASGSALIGGYAGMLSRMSPDGSSLTALSRQPGKIFTMETDAQGNIYVAGQVLGPTGSGSCFQGFYFNNSTLAPGDIFLTKLQPDSLQQVFSARLFGACQSWPGTVRIGPSGDVTVSLWTFGSFPVRNPVLPFSNCGFSGSALVSRLSADGSALLFSSYLDTCGRAAPVALAPDGSVYAGVTGGSHAGLLRVPVSQPSAMSVERIVNAFSGASGFAYPGMLLTITGQNLAPEFLDLGLNDPNSLPTKLGGVQILFDDALAEMFQVAPDHLICVVPGGVKGHDWVSVQVVSGNQTATPFVLPVESFENFGFLTRSFPNLPPAGSVDGNIRNADGTLNDAQHPAAPGSTVTLFATGLAGPGAISLLWNAPPIQRFEMLNVFAFPATSRHVPGFIDALYAIDFRIPDYVPVPGVLTRAEIGRVGSGLGVYVQ